MKKYRVTKTEYFEVMADSPEQAKVAHYLTWIKWWCGVIKIEEVHE